eukprot:381519-Pleurochrysis_carterae.AAC.1
MATNPELILRNVTMHKRLLQPHRDSFQLCSVANCFGLNASLFHFLIESLASQDKSRQFSFHLRPSIINRYELSHARCARAQTHEHRRARPRVTFSTATTSPAMQSLQSKYVGHH